MITDRTRAAAGCGGLGFRSYAGLNMFMRSQMDEIAMHTIDNYTYEKDTKVSQLSTFTVFIISTVGNNFSTSFRRPGTKSTCIK